MESFPELKAGTSKIVDIILLHREELYTTWRQVLREQWRDKASSRELLLEKEIAGGEDLLSLVSQMIAVPDQEPLRFSEPLISKIRRTDVDYSVFDVFLEASSLDRSWDEIMRQSKKATVAELLEAGQALHQNLCQLLQDVLHLTIDTYRYILESGSRGFCQIDPDGIIIHSNAVMNRLLGPKNPLGRRLEEFFQESDREFVRRAYSGANGRSPGIRELHLMGDSGQPVGAEIAPIYLNGSYQGGYACCVDLSMPRKAETEMLNKTPFGMARVDFEGRFKYANPKALEIFGLETWEGRTLWEVFQDEDHKIVAAQLELREQGQGDEYEADVTRVSDRRRIPVKIYSRPETDLQGKAIGSLAMLRNLEGERAIAEMHKAIETIPNGREILQEIATQTYRRMPYDLFNVFVYSAGLSHRRRVFAYAPNQQEVPKWQVRWSEAPDFMVAWLKEHQDVEAIDDLEGFVHEKGWQSLKNHPDIKAMLQAYRSLIRYPVIQGHRVVAAVTIFSKTGGYFSPYKEFIESLPLDKAAIMALHYEEKENLKFLLALIEEISAAELDIHHVAEVIMQRLAGHYDWSNVSLFRVDKNQEKISLMSQKPQKTGFGLPSNYRQDINEGILGYVQAHEKAVKIANVKTDPFFKNIYKSLVPGTVSELCLPIKTSTGYWLLNIEDEEENAFSEEDQEALEGLLKQIAVFLDRAWLKKITDVTLFSTSDLVIITDKEGTIKQVNPAVTTMLGYQVAEMDNKPLKDYCKDPRAAEDLLGSGPFPSEKLTLVGKTGAQNDILLSASALPEELGGWIFIGKDLSLHKRVEELEFLGRMYYEVATQTKTPLAVAFSLLKSLKKDVREPKAADLLDKTLKQLNKVELTLDRLAIAERGTTALPYNEILMDISELLEEVFNGLPQSEVAKIRLTPAPVPVILVRGDLLQLSFCLATIFSYLLRFAAEDKQIFCRVSSDSHTLVLEISGAYSPQERVFTRAAWDIALGQPILEQILKKHRGQLIPETRKESLIFTITLPKAQEM